VLEGVVKRFGALRALDGVDLLVPPGVVVGLVGPNGSGKTSALHVAAGLLRVDAGAALVAGAPAGSRAARAAVALVPDEPAGFEELTAAEYIALVHGLFGADERARARARLLVEAFVFGDRLQARLGTLSRGLRRQAGIVAALSLDMRLALVDEASSALDPEAAVVLREAAGALARRGVGVLLATQDLAFAEASCDEVVLLCQGRVAAAGSVGAVLRRYGSRSLEEAFFAAIGQRGRPGRVRAGLVAL
jgi:ABC-2 type transport system ATP-binding protein